MSFLNKYPTIPHPWRPGWGWRFSQTISHHSKGNMQRHSPRQRVKDGVVRRNVGNPLPTVSRECVKIAT